MGRHTPSVSARVSQPRPRPGAASMDVIRAPAVAVCRGRSDSTQKLDSTGDLRRRGGAANARRRDGCVVADEADDLAEAGAARRREADERSSDLAAAAAIVVGAARRRWGFPVSLCCRWKLCNSDDGLERGDGPRGLFGSAQCYRHPSLATTPSDLIEPLVPGSPNPLLSSLLSSSSPRRRRFGVGRCAAQDPSSLSQAACGLADPAGAMRLKVISRSTDEFTRERSQDLQKVFRNYDPLLRSQAKAVEYTRALNAAKLEKIFAKPFVGAMNGHIDAVSCMAKNPNHLKAIFSGSMDGDIRLWDIAARKTVCQFPGHQGAVRGLTTSTDGDLLVSCGVDCTVRLWKVPLLKMVDTSDGTGDNSQPSAVYTWKHAFWGADHQWDGNLFATVGAQVDIWDPDRSEPINSFEWGKDTVLSVRFDPGDCNILITSGSDRSLTLYDLRMSSPARKLIMKTRCNSVCWNPREPMNFTAANEDTNCYSFDARRLDEAKIVHKGHVSAVMDIDYSPTGREFVTGSYDRTVRIFNYLGDHSREIYHTKRMQRVFCVKYTYDGTYLVSGSDDTNLRLWKSKASEQLGVLLPRERKKQEYQDALKERYKHLPEVKRIVRHRHLPKPIYKAANLRRTMIETENRKEERRRKHSAPGSMPVQPFRKRRIIKEVE